MKSCKEIKMLAREAFRGRYWFCVGMLVLMTIIFSALNSTIIGSVLLLGPFAIGLNFLFINVFTGAPAEVGTPFTKAFEDFGRKLGGYWWKFLHLFLWFLIPIAGPFISLVKSYAYSQTCYLLADCPNVAAEDALSLSRRMMKGHKWQLFCFQLSFFGWWLLSVLTCGLLHLFYLGPWYAAARSGWYLELREQCLREGVITADELNGVRPEPVFQQYTIPGGESESEG